jgi:hypothetical protein
MLVVNVKRSAQGMNRSGSSPGCDDRQVGRIAVFVELLGETL